MKIKFEFEVVQVVLGQCLGLRVVRDVLALQDRVSMFAWPTTRAFFPWHLSLGC